MNHQTDLHLKIMKEKIDCPECEGTGECNYTCCGDDINDIGICKSCGEHSEASDCDNCNGSGKIDKPKVLIIPIPKNTI